MKKNTIKSPLTGAPLHNYEIAFKKLFGAKINFQTKVMYDNCIVILYDGEYYRVYNFNDLLQIIDKCSKEEPMELWHNGSDHIIELAESIHTDSRYIEKMVGILNKEQLVLFSTALGIAEKINHEITPESRVNEIMNVINSNSNEFWETIDRLDDGQSDINPDGLLANCIAQIFNVYDRQECINELADHWINYEALRELSGGTCETVDIDRENEDDDSSFFYIFSTEIDFTHYPQ